MKHIIIKTLLAPVLLLTNTIYNPLDGFEELFEVIVFAGVALLIFIVAVPLITIFAVNKKNRKSERENKEQQLLPNSTLILVFGILSIATLCCFGIIGLILGIITLILADKATKLYDTNPEEYIGFQNVKTGRIIAFIGVVLNLSFILFYLLWS